MLTREGGASDRISGGWLYPGPRRQGKRHYRDEAASPPEDLAKARLRVIFAGGGALPSAHPGLHAGQALAGEIRRILVNLSGPYYVS